MHGCCRNRAAVRRCGCGCAAMVPGGPCDQVTAGAWHLLASKPLTGMQLPRCLWPSKLQQPVVPTQAVALDCHPTCRKHAAVRRCVRAPCSKVCLVQMRVLSSSKACTHRCAFKLLCTFKLLGGTYCACALSKHHQRATLHPTTAAGLTPQPAAFSCPAQQHRGSRERSSSSSSSSSNSK
jgi:hypothetical protein